jgi:hypothetical protein
VARVETRKGHARARGTDPVNAAPRDFYLS